MVMDELTDPNKDDGERRRAKWIGIYIAILAVLLAMCNMGGNNATKDAAKANLDATNLWAFFQAKNLRRTHYILWRDDLERELAGKPEMAAEFRQVIAKHLTEYKGRIAKFTSDKERNEGLDELFVRAKELEKVRDVALARDPYFDYGMAFLQIAIVMASVAIVTGGGLAIVLSIGLGAVGGLFMINGFYLNTLLTTVLAPLMAIG
ncbi:MAG: DUF4337 domain-containing protein [Pseudomonadota bacterium]